MTTAHTDALYAAQRLRHEYELAAYAPDAHEIVAAELRNVAQMVSSCEPHEREAIAERISALASALDGTKGGA